jgi:sulfur relay (sulfurtransferase) complex TusBCD TusD component (DsrE family)
VLVSAAPDQSGFSHALGVARAALNQGVSVYLYCIDDAVTGVGSPRLQKLRSDGVKLFACAYAAQRRRLPMETGASYAGLGTVNELIAACDRFVTFN